MTIKQLEEIKELFDNRDDSLEMKWVRAISHLLSDDLRLRSELNAIQGKAREALDG